MISKHSLASRVLVGLTVQSVVFNPVAASGLIPSSASFLQTGAYSEFALAALSPRFLSAPEKDVPHNLSAHVLAMAPKVSHSDMGEKRTLRVLVVDDEQKERANRKGELEQLPARYPGVSLEITEATDAPTALALYVKALERGEPFDLIVTDFNMVRTNGVQLAIDVRTYESKNPKAARTTIFMVAGGVSTVEAFALKHGIDGVFEKREPHADAFLSAIGEQLDLPHQLPADTHGLIGRLKTHGPHEGVSQTYADIQGGIIKDWDVSMRIQSSDHLGASFQHKWEGPAKPELVEAEKFQRMLSAAIHALKRVKSNKPAGKALMQYIRTLFSDLYDQPNPILFRVSTDLKGTTAVRHFNPQTQQVEILFSKEFFDAITTANETQNPADETARIWLLAERLFHEFGHKDTIGDAEKERYEEHRLMRWDLALHRYLQTQTTLVEAIKEYFKTPRAFPSGYYFRFIRMLTQLKRRVQEKFIGSYLKRQMPDHPTDLHTLGGRSANLMTPPLGKKEFDERVEELLTDGALSYLPGPSKTTFINNFMEFKEIRVKVRSNLAVALRVLFMSFYFPGVTGIVDRELSQKLRSAGYEKRKEFKAYAGSDKAVMALREQLRQGLRSLGVFEKTQSPQTLAAMERYLLHDDSAMRNKLNLAVLPVVVPVTSARSAWKSIVTKLDEFEGTYRGRVDLAAKFAFMMTSLSRMNAEFAVPNSEVINAFHNNTSTIIGDLNDLQSEGYLNLIKTGVGGFSSRYQVNLKNENLWLALMPEGLQALLPPISTSTKKNAAPPVAPSQIAKLREMFEANEPRDVPEKPTRRSKEKTAA